MEDLERERFRIERRRCNSLWRTIHRHVKHATSVRIHCRRFASYNRTPVDPSVAAVCDAELTRQPAAASAASGPVSCVPIVPY
jgi:hypothetical protein